MKNFNKNLKKKVTSIVASLALAGGLSASRPAYGYSKEGIIGAVIGFVIGNVTGALVYHLISSSSKKSAENANYEAAVGAKRLKLENSAATLLSNVIKIETLIENENLKYKFRSEAMRSLKILKDKVAEYYPGFMKAFNGLSDSYFSATPKTYSVLAENLRAYIKGNLSVDQFSDLTSRIDIANEDCAMLLSSLETEITSANGLSQSAPSTLENNREIIASKT